MSRTSTKPIPYTPLEEAIGLSSIEIFIVFIMFSIVTSLWTNIGTMILKKYLPSPSRSSLWKAVLSTIIITAFFAISLSYMGLSLTNFDKNS